MSAVIRIFIVLALLASPALATPARARADGCQNLLPPGVYEGTTTVDITISGYEGSMLLQQFTYKDTGVLKLTIDCDVSAATYRMNVYRTIMLVPNTEPYVCQYVVDFSGGTGSVVTGANGQPRIDVNWGPVSADTCIGPEQVPASTWKFSLDGPPQGRDIGGDFRYGSEGNDLSDYDTLAEQFRQQGFDVIKGKGWELTRLPQPKVGAFSASLRQYFLAGIPVTNRYTAAIDWDNAPPGEARFLLGSDAPRAMTVNGGTATYNLAIGSVPGTGDIPISVEAEIDGRVGRRDGLGPLTLVPVPAWAGPFNLQAKPQSNSVRYDGSFAVPLKPLDAHVVLPSQLPYVGGVWGILPTQFKVALAANSSGARETGGVSVQGGFGLGKDVYKLATRGNIYGTITHDALVFESDELTLTAPPIAVREHLGLASLVPGASALFSLPVIGGLLQALDSSLGVTAEIHGTVKGRGRLGVTGNSLGLTQGSYEASMGVKASGGLDTPFAWATVAGGGDGSLSMQLIPTSKVLACKVLLWFQTRAGALGFSLFNLHQEWPVYTCTLGTGQTVLLEAAGSDQAVGTVYGAFAPVEAEQDLVQEQVTNGLPETVLAENASLQARPQLASGPNGRQALVWNTVSASGAADAVRARLFDGAAWGVPITLSEPGRPSFAPSAAFAASGNLLVTWAEAQVAPDPAGLTEAFARSLEVAWAEVNTATGQAVRSGKATSDNVMDFAPRLSRGNDGAVWLVWQSSPGADMAGAAGSPNQFKATAWTGSGWSPVESAGQNGVGVLFWDVAAADANRVWIAADIDTDGDLGTAADREIYIYKRTAGGWSLPFRRTTNAALDTGPLLAVTPAGQPVLAWRHGDGVWGIAGDPTTTPSQVWFDDAAGVGPMLGAGRLLAGGDGSRVLLWPEGTEDGQDVWLSRTNPASQTWTQPGPLFLTAEQRRTLSASLLPDGGIDLGLATALISAETVTLAGGGTVEVPAVGASARLLVAHVPPGYIPAPEHPTVFLPNVMR